MELRNNEELRSFHVDYDKGIFAVNGEQVPLCTKFLLEGLIGRRGPVMTLTLTLESYFCHGITDADRARMEKASPCDGGHTEDA